MAKKLFVPTLLELRRLELFGVMFFKEGGKR